MRRVSHSLIVALAAILKRGSAVDDGMPIRSTPNDAPSPIDGAVHAMERDQMAARSLPRIKHLGHSLDRRQRNAGRERGFNRNDCYPE